MQAPKRPAIDSGLQFGLRNRWYPIYESRDLGTGKPVALWAVPFTGAARLVPAR